MTYTIDPTSPSLMMSDPLAYSMGYMQSTISLIWVDSRFFMKSLSMMAPLMRARDLEAKIERKYAVRNCSWKPILIRFQKGLISGTRYCSGQSKEDKKTFIYLTSNFTGTYKHSRPVYFHLNHQFSFLQIVSCWVQNWSHSQFTPFSRGFIVAFIQISSSYNCG